MPRSEYTTLATAETPALVLDRAKLMANCDRMRMRCQSLGVRLRPNMKTLKSIDAAHYALGGSQGGIATATLNEAEYFADRGLADIQYAVCMSPDKLPRAAGIMRRAPLFSFFVDSLEVARRVVEFGQARDTAFRVWLEVDSGEHRTGADPEDPLMIQIAHELMRAPIEFQGVATHAGQSYRAFNLKERQGISAQERMIVSDAADRLRAAGVPVAGVSAGSTPTALHMSSADGITELRAGVYMAGDLFQVAMNSLSLGEVAVTVLATVISHNSRLNQVVIDAGGLALSKDRSTAVGPGPDMGYGLVLDVRGRLISRCLTINEVHQEHGEIRCPSNVPLRSLPIGSRVRIVPNHVCMTAAMYTQYLVVDGSDCVVAVWDRTNGWS